MSKKFGITYIEISVEYFNWSKFNSTKRNIFINYFRYFIFDVIAKYGSCYIKKLGKVKPLIVDHSLKKVYFFIQNNNIKQLIKYLIVTIDHKDYGWFYSCFILVGWFYSRFILVGWFYSRFNLN